MNKAVPVLHLVPAQEGTCPESLGLHGRPVVRVHLLGPMRATWRPETQDLIFSPLSTAQPEVLRVPIQEFFEHMRTERFQVELNSFDPQNEPLRKAILLTRMDWLNLDRLRKAGEVLDCSTDAQVVNWALGYLGLSRSQALPGA